MKKILGHKRISLLGISDLFISENSIISVYYSTMSHSHYRIIYHRRKKGTIQIGSKQLYKVI